MLIELINLVKFGTLSGGAGLAGVFDGNLATTGYAQAVVGYAGVALTEPARIRKAEVTSATNGFDASGSTTGIELRLYGKNGMPSSADDGMLLASSSFTDQNVQRTITLESTDSISAFTHVWVKIHTGVWAVAADVKFYEETAAIPELEPIGSGSRAIVKSCNSPVSLPYYSQEIPEFRIRFRLTERRLVLFDFQANVVHVGEGAEVNYVSGYSFRICRRFAETMSGLASSPLITINNAVSGGNVSEKNPQHYGALAIPGVPTPSEDPEECGFLDPGYHEIVVLGSGHTYLTTTNLLRVLTENGKGLNCLRVVVLP